ncbi:MAG: hypothetical protein ACREIP_06755 [Alphaproteobacteria bacterium]
MVLIFIAIGWAILGLAVALIAAARGRRFWPWLIYGLAFWPMAFLHLFFGKSRGPGAGPFGDDAD